MFRHSTKQNERSQEYLRKRAIKALNDGRQILCGSVYENTYAIDLPASSKEILDNIVVSLTGCNSSTCIESRRVFTVFLMEYESKMRLRMCFIQPEVASATAHTSSAFSMVLSSARTAVTRKLNNPSPGGITSSEEKCQVTGRISPYVVDQAGLTSSVSWGYCNAAKSRFMYCVSTPEDIKLMGITKETISIYQGFCVEDCAIVYATATRCFKITAAPGAGDTSDDPNKSTCMFLYCDGTFKVLGTPHKAYNVCRLFRDTVIRAHSSSMHSRIVSTLIPLSDVPNQSRA